MRVNTRSIGPYAEYAIGGGYDVIPQSIIDKAPSAGLWAGQTDEDEMGFSYGDLERYLIDGPEGVAPALAMRIERLMRTTEHKRAQVLVPPGD